MSRSQRFHRNSGAFLTPRECHPILKPRKHLPYSLSKHQENNFHTMFLNINRTPSYSVSQYQENTFHSYSQISTPKLTSSFFQHKVNTPWAVILSLRHLLSNHRIFDDLNTKRMPYTVLFNTKRSASSLSQHHENTFHSFFRTKSTQP